MADIAPFRGIRYDTTRVDPSKVIAPPYDVIAAEEQKALAGKDPHNCVRVILPEGEGDAKYAAAADTMSSWLADGVLVRDSRPAIYRYHQVYSHSALGTRTVVRRGFIAQVRLHEFDEGVVLPHERTLKGPKVDRLKLWESTGAHLSQIFGLYSDPAGNTDRAFRGVEAAKPDVEATSADGTRHLLWRVMDRELIGKLVQLMAPLKLYIADGHHRYETMLAMRQNMRKAAGGHLGWKSAGEYGTMFLTNMSDSGLVMLPTHRLIHGLADFSVDKLLEKARELFLVTTLEGIAADPAAIHEAIGASASRQPSFVAAFPGRDEVYLMTLDAHVNGASYGMTGPRAVTDLDVSVLHSLMLEYVLGIDKAAQEAKTNICYIRDTAEALARTAAGEGQVCFLLNPTGLSDIRAVADAGAVMPQKSTYFYPKIASGLVFTPIDSDEEVG